TIDVAWQTLDGTATAGDDYAASSGVVSFAPDVRTATVSVPIVGDSDPESDETVIVTANEVGVTGDPAAQGTLTIVDDESVTVSVHPVAMFEGPAGAARKMEFYVTLSRPAPREMTVGWETVPGTATAPADFTADSDTLTFAAGDTHKTVPVAVRGSGGVEPDENLTLQLTAPTNGLAMGERSAEGTILDDDDGRLRVAFGNCPVPVEEGDAGTITTCAVPLMVSRKPQRTFTLEWRTGGGTATAGRDFVSVPRKSVKVSKARTVQVKVQGDGQAEQTEWFRVVITRISRDAVEAASPGRVIVVDHDPPVA
ncbi:Calx-beta domain-containing protein, partial [Nocardioides sp.]|uniref:Calx-beta domain-containing protein n=1 Tax=Nocardioides sp. TaxID=35761 RepID=UPI002D80C6C0